jgi:hypothetical protein
LGGDTGKDFVSHSVKALNLNLSVLLLQVFHL